MIVNESQTGDFLEFLKKIENSNWVSHPDVSFFPAAKNTEGKYIIIESEDNEKFSVNNIHPFTLQKFLEINFPGFTDLSKLGNGNVMLKTKTAAQADKFIDKVIDLYDHGKVRVNNVNQGNYFW